MTKRSPFLIYFLAFVSAVFIGILIFVYFVTKQANPIMLDEKGKVQSSAAVIVGQPLVAAAASPGGQPAKSRLAGKVPAPQRPA